MVTYIEFLEEAKNKLHLHLPEGYRDLDVEVVMKEKRQNIPYDGLSIRKSESDAGIFLNLYDIYEVLEKIDEIPMALDVVADRVVASIDKVPINLEDISYNREYFRRHVGINLLRKDDFSEYLEYVPHRIRDDMVVLYRLYVPQPNGEYISAAVTRRLMEEFKVEEEELYRFAARNTQEMWPLCIDGPLEEGGIIYNAYGKDGNGGVSCIYYPDFAKQAERVIGGNFYILPFCIFHAMLIKDTGDITLPELRDMAFKLTAALPDAKYRLTKNIYYCNVKEGTIAKAGEYVN